MYRTLEKTTSSFIKEKNSKFYGFAYPISAKEELNNILSDLKSEYENASHYCYAYRLDIDGNEYRYNDDGEPSNSAGAPIYRQLLSANIVNVLVVVVRIYGGKKLGVAGLIEAYGECARLCLDEKHIITKKEKSTLVIATKRNCGYLFYQLAAKMKWADIEPVEGDPDQFKVSVDKESVDEIEKMLKELQYFELLSP